MMFLTKKLKMTYIMTTLLTMFVCTLFLQGYTVFRSEGDNYFHVSLNGEEIGVVADPKIAEELLLQARKRLHGLEMAQARREIAVDSDDIVFMDADLKVRGEEVIWGELDDRDDMQNRMRESLSAHIRKTMHRAYSMKVNEYMVNLGSIS